MTPSTFGERLGACGLNLDEVPAKAALYEIALGGFSSLTSSRPERLWWIPGRLEVFGKHTDYAGGRTLVAALPRGFVFLGSVRSDDEIRVADASSGEQVILDRDARGFTGWRRYVEVVVSRLARNFPGARRGVDIAFASDLPPASGMSSSSALVVGVAEVLASLWRLRHTAEWRQNIRDDAARATYFACVENGRTFGGLDGDGGVGTHGGSEDHAAMLLGKPGHVSAFSFGPMRRIEDVRVPGAWQLAVAWSGVAAEKTGAVSAQYNRLSEGTDVLLRLWNQGERRHDSLAAALGSSRNAPGRLRSLARAHAWPGWPPTDLEQRLEHFVREDARILEAVSALRAADRGRLQSLAEGSQRDAECLLGNQIPESSALVEAARRAGAFASCSFGAGFGGSAWAAVDASDAHEFIDRWMTRYREPFPTLPATAFLAPPGPASTEVIG